MEEFSHINTVSIGPMGEDRRSTRRSELGLDGAHRGSRTARGSKDLTSADKRGTREMRKSRYARSSSSRSSASPMRAAQSQESPLHTVDEKKVDKDGLPTERRRLKRGKHGGSTRGLRERRDGSLPFYIVAWSPDQAYRSPSELRHFLPDLALEGDDSAWCSPGREESYLALDLGDWLSIGSVTLTFGPNDEQKPKLGELYRAARTATRCPEESSSSPWISLVTFEVPVTAPTYTIHVPRDGLVPTRFWKLVLGESFGTAKSEKKVLTSLSFSLALKPSQQNAAREALAREAILSGRQSGGREALISDPSGKRSSDRAVAVSEPTSPTPMSPTSPEEGPRSRISRQSVVPNRVSLVTGGLGEPRRTLTGITERTGGEESDASGSSDYDEKAEAEEKKRELARVVRNKLRHRLRMSAYQNPSWLDDWSSAKVHMFSP